MTDTLAPPETPRPSRRSKRKRSRMGTGMFIVLLVALGLVATGVLPVRDFLGRENAVDAANEQLVAINAQNDRLAADIAALDTEEEVERIAREQYGFVRPGEIGYVAVVTDSAEAQATAPNLVAGTPDDRSLLEMIWDFITGNDLSVDE